VMLKDNVATPVEFADTEQAFSVPFPESVYHQQRRQSYRVPIGRTTMAKASLESHQRPQPLSGRIINLSPSGAACVFSGYVRPAIANQEQFEACHLCINGELNLHCAITAVHPRYDRVNNVTVCGLEFIGLGRVQQKELDRCVLDLQRDIRKESGRRRYTALA